MTETKATDARIARFLAQSVDEATRTLADFRARLEVNPTDAFAWADASFNAAAKLEAAARLLAICDRGTARDAIDYAMEMTFQGARHPESSTSACSNLLKTAVTAAYADFAHRFVGA